MSGYAIKSVIAGYFHIFSSTIKVNARKESIFLSLRCLRSGVQGLEIGVMVQVVAQLGAVVWVKAVCADAEMRGNGNVPIPCCVRCHAEG